MYQGGEEVSLEKRRRAGGLWRMNAWVEERFEAFKHKYELVLRAAMRHRTPVMALAFLFVAASLLLIPGIGEDFFPSVDAGQFRLHVRLPAGTRLESSELVFGEVERTIRRLIPPQDIELMRTNIGLAGGGVALATGDLSIIGPSEGEILVTLSEKRHGKTADYQQSLRDSLGREFPGDQFWYQPADVVTQVLNQGLAAPINVQIVGRQRDSNYMVAQRLANEIRQLPGASDVRVGQVVDEPEIFFNVDRARAQTVGLTQRDVASALLVSLSSSFASAPNFWLDPTNGVNYTVSVQTPQYKIHSIDDLAQTPVTAAAGGIPTQLFANLATTTRRVVPASISHYNIQPAFDVYARATGRDLGGVAHDVDAIIAHTKLPTGSRIVMRGQVLQCGPRSPG